MDFAAWILIIGVVLIGAASAWIADVWGHRIGKKRLTFWKFRPKQIARFGVIALGMLLPLLTIALIWFASADFRIWLSKGRQAIAELQSKTVELDKVNQSVVDKTAENSRLEQRNRILTEESDKNFKEVQEQKTQLKTLDKSLDAEQKRVQSMQSSLQKLNLLNEKTRTKFAITESLFKQSKASLDAVQKSLISSKAEYVNATARYNEISSRNLLLTSENGELQTKNREVSEKLAALQDQLGRLSTDISKLEQEKKTADSQAASAKAELAIVANELQNIEERVKQLGTVYTDRIKALDYHTRMNPVTFMKGEELGRTSIEPNTTDAESRNIYRSLMRRSRTMASARGATPDESLPFSGAAGMLVATADNRPLSEDEVENLWAKRMASQRDSNLIVFKAAVNCFTGEPVMLEILVLPNPIVFRKGEFISETRIDARLSDLEVLIKVQEFLKTFVNTKARMRNMIPTVKRDGESYGEFPPAQLLSTVDNIRRATREVRVVAIATADIRAGDSLQLELQIR